MLFKEYFVICVPYFKIIFPFFCREESEIVMHSDDPIAPVGYLKFNKLRLELKLPILDLHGRLLGLPLKDPDGYVTDHGEDALDELTEKGKHLVYSNYTLF